MSIDISWAFRNIQENYREYDLFHNYYWGMQEQYYGKIGNYKELANLIKSTRENVCKPIVDIICSRLELNGFQSSDEEVVNLCNDYIKINRISTLSKGVHKDCCIYGDAYVSVWKESKDSDIKLYLKNPNHTTVHYDENNRIDSAVSFKYITDLQNNLKTVVWLYEKDRIVVSYAKGHGLPSKIDNISKEIENPFGIVPIFHFFNGYLQTDFARSDLAEVIPLQRTLNKTIHDRTIASELAAAPQKWVTGIDYEIDPKTKKKIAPFESNITKMMMVSKEDVRFGSFPSADLSNYTGAIDSLHNAVSCVSRVPMHLLNMTSGNFPSGEALKTAEAPLIAKIKDKQVYYGDVWEDIFKLILNDKGMVVNDLEAIWKDTQAHNELEQTQVASNKMALGVKQNIVLREMGYSDEEINEAPLI